MIHAEYSINPHQSSRPAILKIYITLLKTASILVTMVTEIISVRTLNAKKLFQEWRKNWLSKLEPSIQTMKNWMA